jgi:hypothetical protein
MRQIHRKILMNPIKLLAETILAGGALIWPIIAFQAKNSDRLPDRDNWT